jgi:ubiquinone/menaquinone biosynthesis C-methylase UbiE
MRREDLQIPRELAEKPLDLLTDLELNQLLEIGKQAGVKLYRFKNSHDELPRVKQVMGFLRARYPQSLLDVGSGRGVFLFPFLDAFPWCQVTSVDILDYRVEFLQDICRGGVDNLTALEADICTQPLPDKSVDVVTMLEVLEHIPDAAGAIRAAVRMARNHVVVTVPSKPDNNPEHIHLLTKNILTEMFADAGCTKLHFDGVPGHLLLIATID